MNRKLKDIVIKTLNHQTQCVTLIHQFGLTIEQIHGRKTSQVVIDDAIPFDSAMNPLTARSAAWVRDRCVTKTV